ncbi:MAG: glucose-6-phosphate isomerase [Lysobacteraceae bacterium]|jgi:glucose-6-phosphate isomerase|nr:glucose-6-phosphate isomerase [Silanimonas sp.]
MPVAASRLEPLKSHGARLAGLAIADLIAADTDRARRMSIRVGGLYANFARQHVDADAVAALAALASASGLPGAFRGLLEGEAVNRSEGRAALHSALRTALAAPAAAMAADEARAARLRMAALAAALRDSPVTDIVNVGIGGSDLGPRLALDALKDFGDGRFRVHFISNVDAHSAQRVLGGLDPATTAAILVSKSFGTQETLLNGALIRDWLGGGGRLYAVSANVPKAEAFGIDPSRVLPMWDWVGGRYSLWSAVGFSVLLALGEAGFDAMLAGAELMDRHALEAPLESNLPLWHGLYGVWNRNVEGHATHAVLPYDERLRLLPAYLQQLVMESLGKGVDHDGRPVGVQTVPVLWGGAGTDSQHSFFQALHQGTQTVPADFIGVVRPDHAHVDQHRVLLSHLLAQTEAMANGDPGATPQQHCPGSRPTTLLLLDRLTPATFGSLVALYEHSVYVQSVVWDINAFDQFGVELGKRLAGGLLPVLEGRAEAQDPVSAALVAEILSIG